MSVSQPVRPPRRRAPRNSLNPDRILDAAITLLDRDGPEAFTMRALAGQLGVGTMAVYSYFKGKDEIGDAVAQHLLETIELPPGGSPDPGGELREVCRGVYRLFTEHPSALQLLTLRPVRGDDAITVIDRMLGLLRRSGLGPDEAARAHVALMQYTVGSALWSTRRERVLCEEGARGRLRAKLDALPAERYPALVALAPELVCAQGEGAAQYETGLDAMLRGLLP
ncbi:TetR/AcrR family transcriptional regulator [Actinacidiphila sp. ITFR-21]|uniref:TetR/AcrR family transcriptional regulator n=1 Tax=Actinacidiphila sp. ITFR-21 TaxID=3075199 RepID=UPI00288AC7AD|nr:TetR/AcrR family transcriptional regulator [Streptomyces sp. ITFR-21]WNI15659.1 TetR/AcrR family transcriptional regulator [Streptomyces sp. ITFR-21]